jgi:hypothetical protein
MKPILKIINTEEVKMNQMPGRCPVCSNVLTVTRLQCGQCGTGIDGSFGLGRLQSLTAEQVRFVETFIKNRGKIKDIEGELGISYPTVVARLNDVVRSMGYDVNEAELSEVDQFEFYQAQAINPNRIPAPPMPAMPARPAAPPAPVMPPTGPLAPKLTAEQKQQILDDLKEGKLSAADAMKKLHG